MQYSFLFKGRFIKFSALILVLILMMSACGKTDVTHTDSSNISDSVSSNENSDDTGFDDGSSDPQSSEMSEQVFNLEGEYSYTEAISRPASDADEYNYKGNCSNLSKNLKGYFDDEAEQLRKEILDAKNTEKNYKITGQKYYISPDGNDENDGKTPETALRTADGLMNISLKKGDAVLFKRDSIFRFTHTLSLMSGVTYGSYGTGDKPKIYGCPLNYANPTLWKPSNKKNVWKVDFAYGTTTAGCAVFDHGKEIGYLKEGGVNLLTKNLDFYHNANEGILYLYYDKGNPGKYFKDIEFCPAYTVLYADKDSNDIVIDNLCIKYAGYGAIGTAENCKNFTVTNCEIGYIGGVNPFNNVRLGNAIGNWNGIDGMYIHHNWIYQTFDTAISPQGDQYSKYDYKNLSYCDNLLEYNGVDFEWFDYYESTVWENIKVEGNICRFTSLGWGNRLEDNGLRGLEAIIKADTKSQLLKNVSFKNNTIDCPGRDVIKWLCDEKYLNEFDVENNKLYVNGSYRKYFPVNTSIMYLTIPQLSNNSVNALNQTELETAWKYFDKSSTSVVKWFD